MNAPLAQPAPQLSALELLQAWADACGPSTRTDAWIRRRRTLSLRRFPTYRRYRAVRRAGAASPQVETQGTGCPHRLVGVTCAWSANAPPAPPSA